jgi:hypothetical protein
MPLHGFEDRMEAQPANMKCAFALESIAPGYWPSLNTSRLSNRWCNGISNPGQADL